MCLAVEFRGVESLLNQRLRIPVAVRAMAAGVGDAGVATRCVGFNGSCTDSEELIDYLLILTAEFSADRSRTVTLRSFLSRSRRLESE